MNRNSGLVAVLLIVTVIGGYMYYQERNTTTIDLPGDAQIQIKE